MSREVAVEVYDADLNRVGWAVDGVEVDATRALHAPDALTLTASRGLVRSRLRQPNASVRVLVDGEVFASGRVVESSGGMAEDDPVTVVCRGHWDRLSHMRAWPSASSPITSQIVAFTSTNAAETVIRGLIAEQSARLGGHVITCPASQGRGPTISITSRYEPVSELIAPHVGSSGLVWRVEHDPASGLVLQVRTPVTVTPGLDWDSPVLSRGEWHAAPASATRAIVTGTGEGDQRAQALVTGTESDGWRVETLVDESQMTAGQLPAAGTAALAKTAAVAGVRELELSEAGRWGWGRTHDVGDSISVTTGWGETVAAPVQAVRLKVGTDGVRVTTHLGPWAGSPWMDLARRQADTDKTLRAIQARR